MPPPPETKFERFIKKCKREWWVPTGAFVTLGILINGLRYFKKGDRINQQRMMRYRVTSQMITVAMLLTGMIVFRDEHEPKIENNFIAKETQRMITNFEANGDDDDDDDDDEEEEVLNSKEIARRKQKEERKRIAYEAYTKAMRENLLKEVPAIDEPHSK